MHPFRQYASGRLRSSLIGLACSGTRFLLQPSAVFLFALVLCTLTACQNRREESAFSETEYREHLENANRILVRDEKKDIEEFIARHQFRMEATGTGLRYQVTELGTGRVPSDHDEVVLAYRMYLLSGTLVYEITRQLPDTFRIAEGRQVRGLEEALRLFPAGTRARIVLPAHLAYGMIGDEKKIPGATPLYYDLHLLHVQP